MTSQIYLAYDFPLASAFLTMLWFFLWVMWFVLLFRVVVDIFRDDRLSGWGKAGWLAFCIVLPFLGVFVYLIARGKDMGHREIQQARAQQEEYNAYIRKTASTGGPTSSADELAKLSEIRARGDITDEEFRKAKEMVLSGQGQGQGQGQGPAGRSGSTTVPTSGR